MKYKIVFILLFFTTLNTVIAQTLKAPEDGMSMVYIMRSNNLGDGLNFRVYDKDVFLGALPPRTYYTYQCKPGNHLFWAASENRDYVEATLEANKTYVIDLRSKIGLVITAVGLKPYSPENKRHVKRVKKVIKKHANALVVDASRSEEKKENIEKALKAYNNLKGKQNTKIEKLLPNMNFEL